MHKEILYALQVGIICLLCACFSTVNAFPLYKPEWTNVERRFLAENGRKNVYPNEHLAVVQVSNQFELGKLTALRFIEWVQTHPTGVIALSSGNTPEYFIKYLHYYKKNWHKENVQQELHRVGIKAKNFPNTSNLRLVQLEEIYPIAPNHTKKISNYILRNYVSLLEIKPQNTLLMDIEQRGILAEKGINIVFMQGIVDMSVLNNAKAQVDLWQKRAIHELQEFCKDYDRKIRQWGGIDFFLGGLTHSGHLAFNEPDGDIDSKTHIVQLNYSTAADISQNVGGIDYARGKLAITVGLGTIALKPDAVKIVIAAGISKSEAVRNAVENKIDPLFPASVLQKFKQSRFYVTNGAAILLEDRLVENFAALKPQEWTIDKISEVLIFIALKANKSILALTLDDINGYKRGKVLLAKTGPSLDEIKLQVHTEIIKRIENGVELIKSSNASNTTATKILHTAPHHEDLMLGCYPLIHGLKNANNYFAFLTSGFNSVPDHYLQSALNRAGDGWMDKYAEYIFNKPYVTLLDKFKAQYNKNNVDNLSALDTVLVLRNLSIAYDINDLSTLKVKIRWLKDEYFPNRQPGDMDCFEAQQFKGLIRETEAEKQLTLDDIPLSNIFHLRSKFYTGHEFKRSPSFHNDVMPFINLVQSLKPNIITLYDDPYGGQRVTKNRVFQILCSALSSLPRELNKDLTVIGYRKLAITYQVQEANLYLPVDEGLLKQQQKIYQACFNTQKMPIFPSPTFEGDNALFLHALQQEQFKQLRLLLGADYFEKNSNPTIKNAKGFVYLNKMTVNQLLERVQDSQNPVDLDEAFIR